VKAFHAFKVQRRQRMLTGAVAIEVPTEQDHQQSTETNHRLYNYIAYNYIAEIL
jgi:hypothetical protein